MGKRTSGTWSDVTYFYDALLASNRSGNFPYLIQLAKGERFPSQANETEKRKLEAKFNK